MPKINPNLLLSLFVFAFMGFGGELHSQSLKRLNIEVMGSAFASSKKQFNYNTNEHIYYEARLGYRLSKYFEASFSAGYQLRNYLYFAQFQQPYQEALLIMDRNYIPVSANIRLYISEFFDEKLKLWKRPDRWDVYLQLSLLSIKGKDIKDPSEDLARLQGAYVPFYKYPYVDVYNRLQVSYIGGVRYNFNQSVGLFIEGGEGLLTNAVIGLSTHF